MVVGAAIACGGKSQTSEPNADAGDGGNSSADGGNSVVETTTGVGGVGGAPDLPGPTEPVDDMELVDVSSPASFVWGPGYLGNWFVRAPEPDALSGDGQAVEIVPPRGDSHRAYRVEGSGHSLGVDLWVQLDHPFGKPMDLSNYVGISFWSRLYGDTDSLFVAVNPLAYYFDAPEGPVASVEFSVSGEWQQFLVLFQTLGVDPHAVVSFDFIAGDGGGDFELWIDDLAFVCAGACPTY